MTALIQRMDQGVIQNMKCYYQRDFLRKLVNHEGTIKSFKALTLSKMQFSTLPVRGIQSRQKLCTEPGGNCGQL
jgi:hypothetical protein